MTTESAHSDVVDLVHHPAIEEEGTDWIGKAAFHLRPVVDRLADRLKRSGKLFMDETTAPVLDPGRGTTKTGYLWALARDDRPWGGEDPPGVVYFCNLLKGNETSLCGL